MKTVVLRHIKASELPSAWAERVNAQPHESVTVIIEKEVAGKTGKAAKPNHTFGMWADREDMADPAAYVQRLRRARVALE
jgi:hypothetical protein